MVLTCFISLKHVAIVTNNVCMSTKASLFCFLEHILLCYYRPYEKGHGYTDRPTQGGFLFEKNKFLDFTKHK